MSLYITEVEIVLYKSGKLNLVTLDADTFSAPEPSKNDDSVYTIKIGKRYKKNVNLGIYIVIDNITFLHNNTTDLPNKIITEDFGVFFH